MGSRCSCGGNGMEWRDKALQRARSKQAEKNRWEGKAEARSSNEQTNKLEGERQQEQKPVAVVILSTVMSNAFGTLESHNGHCIGLGASGHELCVSSHLH